MQALWHCSKGSQVPACFTLTSHHLCALDNMVDFLRSSEVSVNGSNTTDLEGSGVENCSSVKVRAGILG